MNTKFEQIIVLGSGAFATSCINYLIQFDLPIIIYESNTTMISNLENIAVNNNIQYINLEKRELFHSISSVRKKSLMFLLGCNYLIPSEVVSNKYLSIVNYHNSLLPKHRGRNAEAWAIYEQDNTTGITWHFVDGGIDTGDIIIQEEVVIDEKMSSLSLLKLQNQIALDKFKEILFELLEERSNHVNQDVDIKYKLHLSKDIPNGGFLNTEWNIDKIGAFLKSMDYGALRVMGHPKIRLNDKIFVWKKAIFIDTDVESYNVIYNKEEDYITINKGKKAVKLISVKVFGGF
ncbi:MULTISPECIES: formyltransferase family protein [Lysinibacillus]|uniref:phosphoribosylglycinamide formyltransferase 1 n=1 Tax=Lysinibacillus xylanilyticus TaxID=582475 RepID=A0ABV3VWV3_9BACI